MQHTPQLLDLDREAVWLWRYILIQVTLLAKVSLPCLIAGCLKDDCPHVCVVKACSLQGLKAVLMQDGVELAAALDRLKDDQAKPWSEISHGSIERTLRNFESDRSTRCAYIVAMSRQGNDSLLKLPYGVRILFSIFTEDCVVK